MTGEDTPYPVEVRRHVWESLVSMLQVYAHAASLGGKEFSVTSSADEAWVKHQESALRVRFSPETGEGIWRITKPEQEECGEFRIDENGTLTFPAGSKPLDGAAIEWIEHLVHAASPDANVPLRQPLGIS